MTIQRRFASLALDSSRPRACLLHPTTHPTTAIYQAYGGFFEIGQKILAPAFPVTLLFVDMWQLLEARLVETGESPPFSLR